MAIPIYRLSSGGGYDCEHALDFSRRTSGHHGEWSSSRDDFDFLVGGWKIRNRKLKDSLTGRDEWDEFDAAQNFPQILQGFGNYDITLECGVLRRRRPIVGKELVCVFRAAVGDTALDSPSEREIARQERMKREG
jgi:hypothetical protein